MTDQAVVPPGARTEFKDLASALVIGIGGSGIHTVSRLRRAIRDTSRPGVTAHDNVTFLAIDSVEQSNQLPPLPPDGAIPQDEFVNIARTSLNAYKYVQQAWGSNPQLRATWDVNYVPPNVSLVEGMKRSRPLGNLVFRVNADEVYKAVNAALARTLALDPEEMRKAIEGPRSRVKVYIAASCAGGTGSSGFLHVLHAVHRAAYAHNVDVAVFPIIYLPDVFRDARALGMDVTMEERAHRSNAYAFLSELDYVISVQRAFDELLCPENAMPTGVGRGSVISSAYLIDGSLSDGTQIGQIDAYDLVATALHALLMTPMRARAGVAAVNVQGLGGDGDFDKREPQQRTAYAGLGAFRAVYPGTTYRQYAQARIRSTLIRDYLMDETANEVDSGQRVVQALIDGILGLRAGFAGRAQQSRQTNALLSLAGSVQDELDERDRANVVTDLTARLWVAGDKAADELGALLPAEAQAASRNIPGVIDGVIQQSGEGLKVLRYAMQVAGQQLVSQAEEVERKKSNAENVSRQLRLANTDGSLSDLARQVQEAAGGLFGGMRRAANEAVKAYADAANQFATNVVQAHVDEAEAAVIQAGVVELRRVQEALAAATRLLDDLKDEADEAWRSDHLKGKDAGAPLLTVLVPSDVLPQVEDSRIALSAWAQIAERIATNERLKAVRPANDRRDSSLAKGGRQWLRDVYATWWSRGAAQGARGIVSFGEGQASAPRQAAAAAILRTILAAETKSIADIDAILPGSIEAAAVTADAFKEGDAYQRQAEEWKHEPGDEERSMRQAISEMLKKTRLVALRVDPGRFDLQGGSPDPVPAVAASGAMREWVTQLLPGVEVIDFEDPEQVVSVTMQFNLPISGIVGLDSWQLAFRQVLENRSRYGKEAMDPPPFLDMRFARDASTRPLVRRAYRDLDMALLVTMGMVLFRLLDANASEEWLAGVRCPVDLVWDDTDRSITTVQVLGYPLRIQNDVVEPNGGVVRLGSTVVEVFDSVARDATLMKGIEDVFALTLARARNRTDTGDEAPRDQLLAAISAEGTHNKKQLDALPTVQATEEMDRARIVRLAALQAVEELNRRSTASLRPPKPLEF